MHVLSKKIHLALAIVLGLSYSQLVLSDTPGAPAAPAVGADAISVS